jgi:hypothetical protein
LLGLLDDFDPNTFYIEKDSDICYLSLSNRVDCYCILDRIDYEWAKQWLRCHSYSRVRKTFNSNTPEGIYARRSIQIPGILPSGKKRYGNLWLHKQILYRAVGPPRPDQIIGDHLDGNCLNNKRSNLRWATLEENAQNRLGSVIRKYFTSRSDLDKTDLV